MNLVNKMKGDDHIFHIQGSEENQYQNPQKWKSEIDNGYIEEENSKKVLTVKYDNIGQRVQLFAKNASLNIGQNWTRFELESSGWRMILLANSYPMKFLTATNGSSDHVTIECNTY